MQIEQLDGGKTEIADAAFMADEGEDRVRESYRGNYERLLQIKRKYDPANLFRLNQNIKP